MALFASLADCIDALVPVEEADLEGGDRTVLAVLRNKGIEPADVVDSEALALLRDIVVAEGYRTAATRLAAAGDSVLWRKADEYRKRAMELIARVDRESLGLATTGSGHAGYASIPVGRG